jgi:XTP/dITP diphosphohydrolase
VNEENSKREIIVASNNRHKLQEMQSILGSGCLVRGASEVVPGIEWDETGTTFLENARIKIAALKPHAKGCLLADDSGLCVDALNGAPGVFSSSFGGVEGDHARNVDRLLLELKDISDDKRTAHFYCLILFVDEHGQENLFEGRCHGRIARQRSGKGGFGYDPVFIPDGFQISMAEMTEEEKNAISHRGRAMASFLKNQA